MMWCFGWPVIMWTWTDTWVKTFTDSELAYDFFQGMFLLSLMGAIEFLLQTPLGLIYKFLVEESHGYNK